MANTTGSDCASDGKEFVNSPDHYNLHPSGIECIDIVSHMDFCLGNVFKYIYRYQHKGNPIQDLQKAINYLNRAKNSKRTTPPTEQLFEADLDGLLELVWTAYTKQSDQVIDTIISRIEKKIETLSGD